MKLDFRHGIAFWLLGICAAWVHASEPMEGHESKVAYVHNFVQLTKWPEAALAAGEPLRICAPESLPWYSHLLELNKRTVLARHIAVLALAAGQLSGCHVIILDGADRALVYPVRRELASRSVLVIGDEMDVRDGVMIAMRMDGNRLVFDIDASLAKQVGLTVSSRLLKLARFVQ